MPIRVGSWGNDGSVEQTNSVDSDAEAANRNSAEQDATQSQSSGGTGACCPSGSTGVQTADQDAENKQAAIAASSAEQKNPKNTNVSIRVLSPGNDGDVSQTNSVESDATATNKNSADQTVEQDQSGSGSTDKCGCKGSTGIQTADQDAENKQAAARALEGGTEGPVEHERVHPRAEQGRQRFRVADEQRRQRR